MDASVYPRTELVNPNTRPKYFSDLNSENLRIVQWNIYAQGFVMSDGFQYCSISDLHIEKRKKMFRKEFMVMNADIYCLQEADIHSILLDILNENGEKYEDIFCAKAKSPCLLYPENFGPDGCCIIYNKDKLECMHQFSLNLESTGSYVSLYAIFRYKSNAKLTFIVACTHLKSKKHFKKVRVVQCKLLLAKLLELMSLWDLCSGFVCGDFNASPDEAVITEMQESMLHFANVYDYLRLGQDVAPFYTSWVFKKEESQSKRSRPSNAVYSDQKRINQSELDEVIDYMWFVDSASTLLQIAPSLRTLTWPRSIQDVPRKEDVGDHGLPAVDAYPSDHLSLIADYVIATAPN